MGMRLNWDDFDCGVKDATLDLLCRCTLPSFRMHTVDNFPRRDFWTVFSICTDIRFHNMVFSFSQTPKDSPTTNPARFIALKICCLDSEKFSQLHPSFPSWRLYPEMFSQVTYLVLDPEPDCPLSTLASEVHRKHTHSPWYNTRRRRRLWVFPSFSAMYTFPLFLTYLKLRWPRSPPVHLLPYHRNYIQSTSWWRCLHTVLNGVGQLPRIPGHTHEILQFPEARDSLAVELSQYYAETSHFLWRSGYITGLRTHPRVIYDSTVTRTQQSGGHCLDWSHCLDWTVEPKWWEYHCLSAWI